MQGVANHGKSLPPKWDSASVKDLGSRCLPGHAVRIIEHVKTYKAPEQSTIHWVVLVISDRIHGRMNLEIEMLG